MYPSLFILLRLDVRINTPSISPWSDQSLRPIRLSDRAVAGIVDDGIGREIEKDGFIDRS